MGRGGDAVRSCREEVVSAQFDTEGAVDDYADSYSRSTPAGRFFRSRMHLVNSFLADCPGGDLLDVGCGPGMMVRDLVDSRPGDFRITALDSSSAMVEACSRRVNGSGDVTARVGNIERSPFPDDSFDVVLALGVLEYVNIEVALGEVYRVLRPGGRFIATMLNPRSPYRCFEWYVYWPLLRLLGRLEKCFGVPCEKRHSVADPGIRAFREADLVGFLSAAGLARVDVAYYDVTVMVPPLDQVLLRIVRRFSPERLDRTVSRRWRRFFGTAYLVVSAPVPRPGR